MSGAHSNLTAPPGRKSTSAFCTNQCSISSFSIRAGKTSCGVALMKRSFSMVFVMLIYPLLDVLDVEMLFSFVSCTVHASRATRLSPGSGGRYATLSVALATPPDYHG